MSGLTVSIILPTYNERANIEVLVPLIAAAFAGVAHEIVVVDDSSPDGTADVVVSLQEQFPTLRLLRRPGREGLGAALHEGYDAARSDLILSSDSDGTFTPAAMRQLYEACTPDVDLVVGVRHAPDTAYAELPWRVVLQRVGSRLGNWTFGWLTGAPLRSFTVNFRVIRRALWHRLALRESSNAFLVEMISQAARAGARIVEFPVVFGDRLHGQSKFSLTREGPRFLRVALNLAVAHWTTGSATPRSGDVPEA